MKPATILKKIMSYSDDNPYCCGELELKYDDQAKKIYEVNERTGKEKSAGIKKVYEYRTRAIEKMKK